MVRIGVVGDYRPESVTHRATTAALHHAARAEDIRVGVTWIPTNDIGANGEPTLGDFDGLLIAPGSPYLSMEGALAAITLARVRHVPLLGTCGGFQHVVIEFARNVLGATDAHHAEYDPQASDLFVTPLSCSLAGQQMKVEIRPETTAAEAYRRTTVDERYYCNFGLNPDCLDALTEGGLVVSGTDRDGEARIIELPDARFFLATLFVPQAGGNPEHPHPLVVAFVRAAAGRS